MDRFATGLVLIAGAGPTGLTLAIDLARRGVPFRLIEVATKPFAGSRGKGLQPRTLEVFEDLGVIDAVLSAGALYPRLRIHFAPVRWGRRSRLQWTYPIRTCGWCRSLGRKRFFVSD